MLCIGVLSWGSPIALWLPLKRENWTAAVAPLTPEETQRVHDVTRSISLESGVYRRQFRA